MGKSSPNLEATNGTLKQQARRLALVSQPAAAFDEAAPAVCRQTVTRNLLEAALPLDGRLAPHQPVVPSLHGLRLRADRDCAGPTGGGKGLPVQHHKVCGKG